MALYRKNTSQTMTSTGSRKGRVNFSDILQERRHPHAVLPGNGLDHEVRAVADVGGRAKKNGGDADGLEVTIVGGDQSC